MKKEIIAGHTSMFLANISWGLMSPLSKGVLILGTISSFSLISFRVGGAAIAFWVASLFIKREKVGLRDLLLLFVASLFAIVFNQGVFIIGLSMTAPINASMVTTTLPIITMIISAMYLKEPITWKKFLGIVIGGAGAILLIVNSQQTVNGSGAANSSIWGILLCFFAQFSYAIYFVLFKKFVARYSPITIMKWMFLFASICYLPFAYKDLISIDYSAISISIYRDIAFIVLGSTFFSYLMIPIGQKYLRPTVASMYNNIQPIVATIAAVMWHLDSFGIIKGVAITLVFSGVYVVNKSKARVDKEVVLQEKHS